MFGLLISGCREVMGVWVVVVQVARCLLEKRFLFVV